MIDSAFISVDVETSGPCPGLYSLLAIGACPVAAPDNGFYVELQPVEGAAAHSDALAVSALSLDHLAAHGLPPAGALARFAAWLRDAVPGGHRPIFVAFNAPFDWMFVCYYFHRYLGDNPFGHTALDIKAFYMGLHRTGWDAARMPHIAARYPGAGPLTHNALADARDQAALFRHMLDEAQ